MSKAENKQRLGDQFDSALQANQRQRDEIIFSYETRLKALDEEKELLELQRDAIKKV